MPIPDHRIRFSAEKIDFANDIGETGQEHDTYPAPGQQPRFDWMRMFLVGLLSCQSSFEEPTQFREGTFWLDLNGLVLKIRRNNTWAPLADVIQLGTNDDGSPLTLSSFFSTASILLGNKPTATFSGHAINDDITTIVIPESIRSAGGIGSHPFVWINGQLLDPRKSEYIGGTDPSSVRLTGGAELNTNDEFTIIMLSIASNFFHNPEVIA